MGHFLTIALSFPSVVYTVLLGVALFYWIFVMVGAAHVNLLGDGAADGAADAAFEGAAKGALEGAVEHFEAGGAEGAHADADGGDVGDGDGGGTTGLMAALKLRSAPATVVLSVILLFSWIIDVIGIQIAESMNVQGTTLTLAKVGLLVLAPILALFPTSIVVRPLARIFTPHDVANHESLVGKLCTVRTGTVTEKFGEALLEDGGAGVVVRVRVDDAAHQKLRRGDQAVIVSYDPDRQEFTVAPMTGLLDDDKPRVAGAAQASTKSSPAELEDIADEERQRRNAR